MNLDFNPVTTLIPANAALYQIQLVVFGLLLLFVVVSAIAVTVLRISNGDGVLGTIIANLLFAVFIVLFGINVANNLTNMNTALGNQRYVTETHDQIRTVYGLSLTEDQVVDLLTNGSADPVTGGSDVYLVGTTPYVKAGQRTQLALYWTGHTAVLVNQDQLLSRGLTVSELPRDNT